MYNIMVRVIDLFSCVRAYLAVVAAVLLRVVGRRELSRPSSPFLLRRKGCTRFSSPLHSSTSSHTHMHIISHPSIHKHGLGRSFVTHTEWISLPGLYALFKHN